MADWARNFEFLPLGDLGETGDEGLDALFLENKPIEPTRNCANTTTGKYYSMEIGEGN